MNVDWRVVLIAFVGGLALLAMWSGWQARRRAMWLAGGLGVAASGLMIVSLLPPAGALVSPQAERARATPSATPQLFAGLAPTAPSLPAQSPAPGAIAPTLAFGAEINEPARLQIPRFQVDEPIVVIPLREGEWDLTALEDGVGWLSSTGQYPGDALAMVLVGHITVAGNQRGAFAQLEAIKPGDEVRYRSGGMEYVYAVRQRSRIEPEAVKQLYVADGRTLLLLTCTDFDALARTYQNRLLVRAELIAQQVISSSR